MIKKELLKKIDKILINPAWIAWKLKTKIEDKLNARIKWNEKRADKIWREFLWEYFEVEKDREEKNDFGYYIYYRNSGYSEFGKTELRKFNREDRKFLNKYHVKVMEYLVDKFQLEGFEKEKVYQYGAPSIELHFHPIEKVE